jgi:hypothetical protein
MFTARVILVSRQQASGFDVHFVCVCDKSIICVLHTVGPCTVGGAVPRRPGAGPALELAVELHRRGGTKEEGEDSKGDEAIRSSNLGSHSYLSVGGRESMLDVVTRTDEKRSVV